MAGSCSGWGAGAALLRPPPNAFSRSPTRTCVSLYAKGSASTWRLALLVATFPAVATCAVGHCVEVRMHIAVVGRLASARRSGTIRLCGNLLACYQQLVGM